MNGKVKTPVSKKARVKQKKPGGIGLKEDSNGIGQSDKGQTRYSNQSHKRVSFNKFMGKTGQKVELQDDYGMVADNDDEFSVDFRSQSPTQARLTDKLNRIQPGGDKNGQQEKNLSASQINATNAANLVKAKVGNAKNINRSIEMTMNGKVAPAQQIPFGPRAQEMMDSIMISQHRSSNDYDSERSTKPLWREKFDINQIYSMEKRLKLSDPKGEELLQIKRWHENDIKGNRMRNYMKEVGKCNSDILSIVKQTRLEQVHNYTDGHKCLNFRKKVRKCRIHISEAALRITSHKTFEGFIILVIGLNCITLAQSDSTKDDTQVEKNIDMVFNIIYTIEMVLRVSALGFVFNRGAYLRSYWNQLDFICVMTAYLEIVGGGGTSLAALRAFRVLRPLRFVNNIEGLKIVVSSVMEAIPVLQDTIIVLFFFFLIFAIGGLNLFMGMLKQRCVNVDDGSTYMEDDEEVICGSLECPVGYTCGRKTLNPNYDVTNFDNIFWALLNVFQCITMEGWSEIMVMYQQAYTMWTFFFFTPMVFIGSFFLLNLTLAVIQSSYSVTQNRIKTEKAKMRAEQEELSMNNAQNKKNENNDDDRDQYATAKGMPKSQNIGVLNFYIAKKAAAKLKAYWKMHQRLMEEKNDELKQAEIDETNQIKERLKQEQQFQAKKAAARKEAAKSLKTSQYKDKDLKSQNSPKSGSILKDLKLSEEKRFGELQGSVDFDNTKELADKVLEIYSKQENKVELDAINGTIQEESVFDELLAGEDVQNFLNKLGNDSNAAPFTSNQVDEEELQKQRELKHQLTQRINPVMAFNDVRIQSKLPSKNFQTFNANMAPAPTVKRNNLVDGAPKDRVIKGDEVDIVHDSQLDRLLEELDYDKLVVAQNQDSILLSDTRKDQDPESKTRQEITDKNLPNGSRFDSVKEVDDLFAVDHPLDLSFTKDKNYGMRDIGYASDNNQANNKNALTKQSIDDFKSSIISSDESIAAKIEQHQQSPDAAFKSNNKQLKTSLNLGSMINKSGPRRMLTVDFKEKAKVNDSQSTYLGNNPSFRQQLDCLSGLQLKESPRKSAIKSNLLLDAESTNKPTREQMNVTASSFRNPENPESRAQKTETRMSPNSKNRKEKLKIYQQIDREWFNPDKPTNPTQFIDSTHQKVIINPGVPYIGTSQNEIFERRILLNQKEHLNKINPFIAAPLDEAEDDLYVGQMEEIYIQCMFDPYQLKTDYQVQQVEEIEWDSDDEDAIVLAQQPFETVMQTGFSNYLNHLSTKFIARRSDIIISSTLSITLTPIDDGFQPLQFAVVNGSEIWEYVMRRQEYRALSIKSNALRIPKRNIYDSIESSLLATQDEESVVESDDEQDYQGALQRQETVTENKLGKLVVSASRIKLPNTLLSQELPGKQAAMLSTKERRIYNIQKQKWQQRTKQLEKIAMTNPENHPVQRVFVVKEARQLAAGTFKHEQDEEDGDKEFVPLNIAGEMKMNLNRAMLVGKNDVQHELDLDNFDTAMQKALIQQSISTDNHVDPRNFNDNVPENLRKAFNLPKDMHNYDIDFEQVRKTDALFKRRVPVWSGQEVLDLTLNMKKSSWILDKINKLRVWPKGFYNLVKKFRAILKAIIRFNLFDNFLTLCVLMNTIVMGMDSYDIDEKTAKDLEQLNDVFTWIFIVEMAIKLLAIGPRKYSANVMNLLDGGVVMLSIIEMAMASLGGGGGAGNLQAFRTVRVFRTFRVLRVTRVLRALKSMATVIGVISRSLMDFVLITILMFVFIFIYTLLGRQIFQGKFDFGPDEEISRSNFESFSVAFITVFQVLTMENWQQVLYVSMRATRGSMIFKTITALYYISWIFIGNFILLNLFLAILIDAFAEEDAEGEGDELDEEAEARARQIRTQKIKQEKEKRMKKLGTSANLLKSRRGTSTQSDVQKRKKKKQMSNFTGVKRLREEDLGDIEEMSPQEIRRMLVENGVLKARKEDNIDKKLVGPEIHAENSVYLFHRRGCFRRNVHFIQKHKWFENWIMLLIALSSTKLALESYLKDLPKDNQLRVISDELDFIFNYLFIVEFVLKVIALGFAMDEGSYMRDSWNRLDFFIVFTSIIDMILTNTDIPALKVLRMLRMIRPLRVISHNPQLKMIVAALFESVGSIINVSVIVMIIWLMFAIYGMNTFMGMFFYCDQDKYRLNTKWVCEDAGGTWERWDSNFDDIGKSMITLFIVASLEGWPDIMYQAIDVTKKDNGPQKEYSPGQSIFFVVFILLGSFFFLNFFIGVLFLKYEQAQKKEEAGFTKHQLYWQELQRLIVQAKTPHDLRYKPQLPGCRQKMHEFITWEWFDIAIMVCIVLNMLQMALDHDGASPGMLMFLQLSNYVFTAVFFFEAVMKLFVYRCAYFKTGWNKFDFFVVASSLIDLAIEIALPKPEGGQESESGSQILTVGPQLARVMRVMRVTRVLRLAGQYEGLQTLLKTIVMSVDSLFNVFILLMLIFFIMAVLGNTMFSDVTEGDVISSYKNFANFHQSFSLLFSISTGEDWNRIMYDCGRNNSLAPVFFLSFIMIVSNIMLNLFILVIIQQFSKYYLEADNPLSRFEEDFEDFKNAWEIYTQRYQHVKIKTKQLQPFIAKLPSRMRLKMGFDKNAQDHDFDRIILKMGINVDDGFIYFNEMLYRIMRQQFVIARRMKFNKVMTVGELVTQFKISEIMLKEKSALSNLSKQGREEAVLAQYGAKPVNLFLTKMYFKTSFKTWHKLMFKILKRQRWTRAVEEEKRRCENIGKDFVQPEYPEEQTANIPVDYEFDQSMDLSCSEDEDDDQDNRSRKGSNYTPRCLEGQASRVMAQTESPENFRMKAKIRMLSSTKKFSQSKLSSPFKAFSLKTMKQSSKKSALIVHTDEEAIATQNCKFVDPNSLAYQNVVLEHKINKHQRERQFIGPILPKSKSNSNNKIVNEYEGQYTSKKLELSLLKMEKNMEEKSQVIQRYKSTPAHLNAPPKIGFK